MLASAGEGEEDHDQPDDGAALDPGGLGEEADDGRAQGGAGGQQRVGEGHSAADHQGDGDGLAERPAHGQGDGGFDPGLGPRG